MKLPRHRHYPATIATVANLGHDDRLVALNLAMSYLGSISIHFEFRSVVAAKPRRRSWE